MSSVATRCVDFLSARDMSPTPVQRAAFDRLTRDGDVLFVAPTGSGKTLAAFLPLVMGLTPADPPGVSVLYIAPTRALVAQLGERLARVLEAASEHAVRPLRIAVRTGDSTNTQRAAVLSQPPDVLVCTPESLAIMLGTRSREVLTRVREVVLDETHLLAEGKRGALLAATLETLGTFLSRHDMPRPRRVGLSATVHPIEVLAAWLGGAQRAEVSVAGDPELPDVALITPGFDAPFPSAGWAGRAMLPAIARRIATCPGATLVFVPSRPVAEQWTQALRDVLPPRMPIACFHGSMAVDERARVARELVDGGLKAVVTTNSLEVGVDVPEAEQVVMLQTPGSVTRLLQSAGRSHHRPGGIAQARIAPMHVLDLLAAVALRRCAARRELEPLVLRRDDLDVAIQAVMGVCALGVPVRFAELLDTLRRAMPFANTTDRDLDAMLDHLETGGAALESQHDVHRLTRDANGAYVFAGGHSLRRYLRGVGTITAQPAVTVRANGRAIGQLDGAFATRLEPGEAFVLAGVAWRVVGHAPGELHVARERNSARRVSRWAGSIPSQSATLMAEWERVHGALDGAILPAAARDADARADAVREVALVLDLAPGVADAVVALVVAHRRRSTLPTPDRFVIDVLIEPRRVHLLAFTFAGERANEVIGRAVAWRWRRRTQRGADSVASDLGVMLSIDRDAAGLLDDADELRELFSPEGLERDVHGTFEGTGFAREKFTEVARVSQLAIPDGRPGAASPGLLYDVLRRHAPGHVLLRALEHTLWTALDGDRAEQVLRTARRRMWCVKTMSHPSALGIPLYVAASRAAVAPDDLDQALVAAAHEMYRRHGETELP